MDNQSHVTVILAMTADGKIADYLHSAARFGSANDKNHLEKQVSLADGVLFGAGTLRAYGTTMTVSNPKLLQERIERSQQLQPVQIVVSRSGNLARQWRFFQQSAPRWLLTTAKGAKFWENKPSFERVLISDSATENDSNIDWSSALTQLRELGMSKLAVLGGGELVASLLAVDAIDEFWLTICPLIFGGDAPTPVSGLGLIQSQAKQLELIEVKQIEQELFLHYRAICPRLPSVAKHSR